MRRTVRGREIIVRRTMRMAVGSQPVYFQDIMLSSLGVDSIGTKHELNQRPGYA